ncbi:MAG: hypothetical protein BroJett011_14340 [Chloroflexota bacterium]|nr:MAG: hypothetical protein BroJett011_14340 [Chloroflexota bacterium]
MPPTDYELKAELDDSQVLAALERIEQKVDGLAKETDSQLGGLGEGLGSAADEGVKLAAVMGGVAGVVSTVTTKVIDLAGQVESTMDMMGQLAVTNNAQFETYETKFKTLLGSAEAAQGRIQELAEFADKTPFELPQVVQASLLLQNFGGDLLATGESLTQIGDMAAATGGDFGNMAVWVGRLYKALQDGSPFGEVAQRFREMGLQTGDAMQKMEAMQKAGEDGNKIWEYFITTVASKYKGQMKDLAETYTGLMSTLSDTENKLIREGGKPFFDEIKAQTEELLAYLTDHEADLIAIAQPIGDIMASIAGAQGEAKLGVIEQIVENKDAIIEGLDGIYDFVQQMKLLVGVFVDWTTAVGGGGTAATKTFYEWFNKLPEPAQNLLGTLFPLVGTIDAVGNAFSGNTGILQGLTDMLAQSQAGYEGIFAMLSKSMDVLSLTAQSLQAAWEGDFAASNELAKKAQEAWDQIWSAGQQAVRQSYQNYLKEREETQKAIEENDDRWRQWQDQRKTKIEAPEKETPEGPTGPSEADYEAAQQKVAKKMEEEEEKHRENLEKIDIESERRRYDMLEDFAERRLNLELKNQDRIEDIWQKFRDAVEDENIGFDESQQDLSIKQAQARIDFERSVAQRRVDIETNYRQTLRDIRQRFEQDAEEYERNRDAVGYLRLMRQRDHDLASAQQARTDRLDREQIANERAREEMQIQQQREIEADQRLHQRKLQQLQQRLNRELEANERRYERELEQQNLYEQRKNADYDKWLHRKQEDEDRANRQRLAKLQEALAKELELISTYTARVTQLAIQRRMELDKTLDSLKDQQYAQGRTVVLGGRAEGGPVSSLTPYVVGERGPELFVPATNGFIVPNDKLMYSPPSPVPGGVSSLINETVHLNIPPDRLTPGQTAEARELALSLMRELKTKRR